jgi:hypothetical protein
LWARRVSDGLYQIDNVPFFVRGISNSDIIAAVVDSRRELRFKALVEPSEHSTIRVILFQDSADKRAVSDRVRELRDQLSKLGCTTELSHLPGLVAVDVPPSVGLDPVIAMLAWGEEQQLWEYEEGSIRRKPYSLEDQVSPAN